MAASYQPPISMDRNIGASCGVSMDRHIGASCGVSHTWSRSSTCRFPAKTGSLRELAPQAMAPRNSSAKSTSSPRAGKHEQMVESEFKLPNEVSSTLTFVVEASEEHRHPAHPEGPARIDAIKAKLSAGTGVWSREEELRDWPISSSSDMPNVRYLAAQRFPTPEEMEAVHSRAYIDQLSRLSDKLSEATLVDDSTYIAPGNIQM